MMFSIFFGIFDEDVVIGGCYQTRFFHCILTFLLENKPQRICFLRTKKTFLHRMLLMSPLSFHEKKISLRELWHFDIGCYGDQIERGTYRVEKRILLVEFFLNSYSMLQDINLKIGADNP